MNPSLDPEVAQPVPSPGYRILVINPGSTSTKVGVYLDAQPLLVSVIRHQPEELAPYKHIDRMPVRAKDGLTKTIRSFHF